MPRVAAEPVSAGVDQGLMGLQGSLKLMSCIPVLEIDPAMDELGYLFDVGNRLAGPVGPASPDPAALRSIVDQHQCLSFGHGSDGRVPPGMAARRCSLSPVPLQDLRVTVGGAEPHREKGRN